MFLSLKPMIFVLYPGRSVTGRFVTVRFTTGSYVTGRFVGVPILHCFIVEN
jgi:hypothetical protein